MSAAALNVQAHRALAGANSVALGCRLLDGDRLQFRRSTQFASRRPLHRIEAQEDDRQASTSEQASPAAQPSQQEEEPVWVRRERERELIKKEGSDLPFGAYLLLSAIVAIAAVGSIFEYTAQNPIFDVIEADSPLYTPILGLFALTGLPTSAFLFYKAVSSANKASERMDKLDGY